LRVQGQCGLHSEFKASLNYIVDRISKKNKKPKKKQKRNSNGRSLELRYNRVALFKHNFAFQGFGYPWSKILNRK
jgi:hypothetical protein